MRTHLKHNGGYLILTAIIIGALLTTIVGGLLWYVVLRDRESLTEHSVHQATFIADAGLQEYAWRLLNTSTTPTSAQAFDVFVADETQTYGTAHVVATPVLSCESVAAIVATSTGRSADSETITHNVVAYFTHPTVAGYATVTSDAAPEEIFAADMDILKSIAQTSGKYFHLGTTSEETNGTRLIFNEDGTVQVYEIIDADSPQIATFVDGSTGGAQASDYTRITEELPAGTYTLPEDCGLIFVEGRVWIEGTVSRHITLAASGGAAHDADVVITGNITQTTHDGSAGITVIADRNVLVANNAPARLSLEGVFVAERGTIGQSSYVCGSGGAKETLGVYGTLASYNPLRLSWNTECPEGNGYPEITTAPQYALAKNPPVFTPQIADGWVMAGWNEQ